MSETGNLTAGRRAAGLGSGDGGIAAAELTRRGSELLATAKRVMIPYVTGGGNLGGMDCQGLIEYLMALCGLRRDWKGSNDMWRNALKWAGTPEAFCERFGAMTGGGKEGDALPAGAAVFIVENDGGEPDEYKRTDEARFGGGKGNASHVGLYLGGGSVIHASASMGKVCESTKFDGRNAVGNGGWNMVGLWADVDYGAELEAALEAYGDMAENAPSSHVNEGDEQGEGLPAESQTAANTSQAAAAALYARVFAENGKPVKLRPQPERGTLYWEVASGTRVTVERTRGGWALIRALCVDGAQRRAWMMGDYLRYEG